MDVSILIMGQIELKQPHKTSFHCLKTDSPGIRMLGSWENTKEHKRKCKKAFSHLFLWLFVRTRKLQIPHKF